MTDHNEEPDYNINNQPTKSNVAYRRPKDVIGFLNPNVDTQQRDLRFDDPKRIPIKEQYEIFIDLESERIYREDGITTQNKHPIFKETMFSATRKYDLGNCLCDHITEDGSSYVLNQTDDCYFTELFMYCKRHYTVYHPVSALLCKLGERDRANPDGYLTGRELFILWREMDLTFDLPNLAIKWFATHEKIANKNSFIEKTSDKNIKYSVLPEALYHKTIECMEKKYDVKINRSPIHNNSEENNKDKSDFKYTIKYNKKECKVESGEKNNTSNKSGHDNEKKESLNQSGNVVDKQNENDDPYIRFLTYEQPAPDEDDVDVDRYAVKQFVDEFTKVGGSGDKQMKTPSSEMINVFTQWSKINNIKLNKLSTSEADNFRREILKKILKDEYNIEKIRRVLHGEKRMVYRPIELSEEIREVDLQ